MNWNKSGPVCVDLEHRSLAAASAIFRGSVKRVPSDSQTGGRPGTVYAVGRTVENDKARAVRLDFEYRSIAVNPAQGRGAIQSAVLALRQWRAESRRRAERVQRGKELC